MSLAEPVIGPSVPKELIIFLPNMTAVVNLLPVEHTCIYTHTLKGVKPD